MAALTSLFHQDATFVNRFGRYVRGVAEIVAMHAAVVHFWSRLTVPAGPHAVDTLILAVTTRQAGAWRIKAFENVTFMDPRSGKLALRDRDVS